MISKQEKTRRRHAVAEAIHSEEMEGDTPGADHVANLEKFANGQMTIDQVITYLDSKWGARNNR